jgi:hypothetical protein
MRRPVQGPSAIEEGDEVRGFLRMVIDPELGFDVRAISVADISLQYVALYETMIDLGIVVSSIPIGHDHFEELFPSHHSSIHLLDVEKLLNDISARFPPFGEAMAKRYSWISFMKRGCLDSDLVEKLTLQVIRCEDQDEELIDKLRILNYLLIYLDMIDYIATQFVQLRCESLLRSLNIKSFCANLSKRLLFLINSSKFEFDRSIGQIRRIAEDPQRQSLQRLRTILLDVLKKCQDVDVVSISEVFVKNPDRSELLLDLTSGSLGTEIRQFLVFLEDARRRSVEPNGALVLVTDFPTNHFAVVQKTPMIPRPTFPIPLSLLDIESQDAFLSYLQKLQEERETFVEQEQQMQQLSEQRTAMQSVLSRLREQRAALVDRFKTLRNSLSAIVRKQKERLGAGDSHEGRVDDRSVFELELTVRTNEKKLKAFESHLSIVNAKCQQAMDLNRELQFQYRELLVGRNYHEVGRLKAELAVDELSGAGRDGDDEMTGTRAEPFGERAELSAVLSDKLRAWNIVTRETADVMGAAEDELAAMEGEVRRDDDENVAMQAKIRKIDAGLKNLKL